LSAPTKKRSEKEFDMALAIVWRNPEPLSRTKQTVQRIQGDQSCAVYVVTNPDRTQEFRLIFGEVA
jgi:hypothetical protein